jgi:hypothetical protein
VYIHRRYASDACCVKKRRLYDDDLFFLLDVIIPWGQVCGSKFFKNG